jgi:hypothetical protein
LAPGVNLTNRFGPGFTSKNIITRSLKVSKYLLLRLLRSYLNRENH